MRQVLTHATVKEDIVKNPILLVKMPDKRQFPQKEIRFFNREECLRIIEEAGRTYSKPTDGCVDVIRDGEIVPELKKVLELVKQYDAVLGTGHISVSEIFTVTRAAREMGVKKIVVTHPEWWIVNMSPDGHTVTLFVVNRSPCDSVQCQFHLTEQAKLVRHISMAGFAPDAVNTADSAPVCPKELPADSDSGVVLPEVSWNMLQFYLEPIRASVMLRRGFHIPNQG